MCEKYHDFFCHLVDYFCGITSNFEAFCSCVHVHKQQHMSDSNTKEFCQLSRIFFSEQGTHTFYLCQNMHLH